MLSPWGLLLVTKPCEVLVLGAVRIRLFPSCSPAPEVYLNGGTVDENRWGR